MALGPDIRDAMNCLQIEHAVLRSLVMVSLLSPVARAQQGIASASGVHNPEWKLSWSDEFDGPNGSAPDPAHWVAETGGKWANNELQGYTARPKNVRIENGNLVIEVFKERFSGSDGIRREYTSARLKTDGRFSQRYGRFEARIKLPAGRGIWPAFWLLGNDLSSVGWPACGEIDIME